MTRNGLLGGLLLALVHVGASAAEDRPFVMFAFEDTSCGAWVASAQNEDARTLYLFWFRGFLSGYNYGSRSKEVPLESMPNLETLALHVDKYCKDNPLKPFISAALPLVKELAVKVTK